MRRRYTGFPPEVKACVLHRADGRCEICGLEYSDMQYHHRRARGMGSTRRPETNRASNCLYVCGMDHLIIESHRAVSLDNGWLVRQAHDPSDVPVVRRGRLVWLDDEGNVEQAA